MQIKDLPFGVIFQLCRQLDSSHAGRFSWRALLSHVPSTSNSQSSTLYFSLSLSSSDSPYNAIDVGAFQRVGHQPNGSPTEAVLQDFIARGFSVDDLYLMMNDMGYVEGMRVLQQYGAWLATSSPLSIYPPSVLIRNKHSLFDNVYLLTDP